MCPIADICEQQCRHLCLQQIVSASGNLETYFAQILALRTTKNYPTLPRFDITHPEVQNVFERT